MTDFRSAWRRLRGDRRAMNSIESVVFMAILLLTGIIGAAALAFR